ncbi:glycosyltransferase [Polaromonas sp. YR568]|uniref:glycosyltransferase n=1 Tax=Polaromonas sp. YR568 TaxID=1855301 RepID=UPI0031379F24
MGSVIGTGVIANRFSDYTSQSPHTVFAGSVNDSSIQNEKIISAEETALAKALSAAGNVTFVYFSSCSVNDPAVAYTPYVLHKTRMEKLVGNTAKKFLIIRLPQVLGLCDTETSLAKFLVHSVCNRMDFELWENAKKNLIDIDDVHSIVGEILKEKQNLNKIFNVANPCEVTVLQLVRHVEEFFDVKARYRLVDKGTGYEIDVSDIRLILARLDIDFGERYIPRSLGKYFGHLRASSKLLSVIVPTYNNENGIWEFYRRTKAVLLSLAPRFEYELIFVNDFSTDNTYSILETIAQSDPAVKLIDFSRNFGNQIGITAGIDYSRGELALIIDDDLQDPPEVINNFIAQWEQGYKVVYGVRPKRQGVNPVFKLVAKLYYRIIGALSETDIPKDTGDFRLIDKVVINSLKLMREENRYYRGMVAWVGFSQIGVTYERDKRYAGVSTFSLKKYVNFAMNGLTSFTDKPLYFSSLVGVFITSISFILAILLVISKIIDPSISIQGWTSTTVIILFFGGIQLLSTGVLGIYISKIYREIKGRPLYIVRGTQNFDLVDGD